MNNSHATVIKMTSSIIYIAQCIHHLLFFNICEIEGFFFFFFLQYNILQKKKKVER